MPRGGFRIETGAIVPVADCRTGKRRGWHAYLTVAPFGAADAELEGEGDTPRAALDRAMADLSNQGAFKAKTEAA